MSDDVKAVLDQLAVIWSDLCVARAWRKEAPEDMTEVTWLAMKAELGLAINAVDRAAKLVNNQLVNNEVPTLN